MRTVLVAVAGGLLTVVGAALLVLPGPGFVLVAAGLAILATEFRWARRPLDYAKDKARQGVDEVARSHLRAALAVAAALALLLVGILDLVGVNLPLVNTLTAACLILSGIFLTGTVVYARTRRASPAADPGV